MVFAKTLMNALLEHTIALKSVMTMHQPLQLMFSLPAHVTLDTNLDQMVKHVTISMNVMTLKPISPTNVSPTPPVLTLSAHTTVLVINTGTLMDLKPEQNVLTTTNVLMILLSVVDQKFQKISTVNVSMIPKDHMNVLV